ncbi:MAG TPA: VWA domain-containing protein [Thiobacillus sp.]|nr:VWA domain-containing protein [Thiobacillus sp.]
MIENLLHLHWREPLWLGLAALPLLFGWWRRRRHARLLRYADAELLPWAASLPAARPSSGLLGGRLSMLAHALAWLLLALAAAGPRMPLDVRDGQPTPIHQVTVMAVLDVSASMRASDIAPDRLTRARLELLDWLPRLQGERVGLIVYAGEAGVLLPPTDDPALLQRALDQVDPRLIEAQGTRLAAALDLARVQLASSPGQAKAVLLVTDAEADSLDEAAQAAVAALRQARLPLFVLGIGSEAGAPVPLPDGGFAEQDGVQVQSRMAASAYHQWAQTTGGRFAVVSDGEADWSALHDRGIAALPGDPVALEVSAAWRELYAWCLAPALALFMALSLPRRVTAIIALAVWGAAIAPPSALADEAAAWLAWQQKQYASAQTLYAQAGGYTGQMGAGAAAWRQAEYAAAVRHFGAALLLAANDSQRADALYNLGNAHYARGQWQAAFEAFETVLRVRPSDPRARANLDYAWQRLRRQRADAPMRSDLGGRRGFLAEGHIQLDGQTGQTLEDPESKPPGVQIDRNAQAANAARQLGAAAPRRPVTVDSRMALSGLKKLERLDDRPAAMLKNLLKQDARHDATERPPW